MWSVYYFTAFEEDCAFFDDEKKAWRFFVEMNEEPDSGAEEPEYEP